MHIYSLRVNQRDDKQKKTFSSSSPSSCWLLQLLLLVFMFTFFRILFVDFFLPDVSSDLFFWRHVNKSSLCSEISVPIPQGALKTDNMASINLIYVISN